MPSLATGGSSLGSTTVLIPTGIGAGVYYIIGVADATGVVPEAKESNNTRALAITVQ